MSAAWVVVVALLAQSEAEREAEMFGPSEEPSAESREPTTENREQRAEDRGPITEDRGPITEDRGPTTDLGAGIASALADRDDILAIGGQLFMRGDLSIDEGAAARDWALLSPALLDVYFDARPNERLRLYARGRLTHVSSFSRGVDPRVAAEQDASAPSGLGTGSLTGLGEATSVDLDQLWLKLDIERQLYVTAGRQQVRWGSGRFWNPTDFLNVRARDPLAVFDERLGVGLLRLHYPIESLGWNLYAIGVFEGAQRADEIGGAGRAEILLGTTEIALSGAARTGDPLQLGADVSSGVWLFDVRAEAAFRHGVETPFRRGQLNLDATEVELPGALGEVYYRDDEWLAQVMVGAELQLNYSDEDSVLIGVEGFYNQAGYDDDEFYPVLLFIDGTFRPLYVGKYYAGAYVLVAAPGDWNRTVFTLSGIANLSDRSALGRLDYAVTLLTYLRLNAYASASFGDNGELHYGFRFRGNDAIRGLLAIDPSAAAGLPPALVALATEGVRIRRPLVDVGLGLTLEF